MDSAPAWGVCRTTFPMYSFEGIEHVCQACRVGAGACGGVELHAGAFVERYVERVGRTWRGVRGTTRRSAGSRFRSRPVAVAVVEEHAPADHSSPRFPVQLPQRVVELRERGIAADRRLGKRTPPVTVEADGIGGQTREHQAGDRKWAADFDGGSGSAWFFIQWMIGRETGMPTLEKRMTSDESLPDLTSRAGGENRRNRRAKRRQNAFRHAPCMRAMSRRVARRHKR